VAAEAGEDPEVARLVAFGTGHAGVPPRSDRETMVEIRAGPAADRHPVALNAIQRESGGAMVGVLGAIVIVEVAGGAILRRSRVDPILVAVRTGDRSVPPLEGKT